jgi:hypothetical protein
MKIIRQKVVSCKSFIINKTTQLPHFMPFTPFGLNPQGSSAADDFKRLLLLNF